MSAQATLVGAVSTAVVRSLIAAARKRGTQRVIGVRAAPSPEAERRFTDAGEAVHILPCVSALAIRQALRQRADGEWLVIMTDRPEDDLGAGILGHFAHQRLQTPGAWDTLKERFGAERIDRQLATLKHRQAVAQGLLRITPDEGWPATPGAVLGIDHAFGAVATQRLALPAGPVDALGIVDWTARPDAQDRIADLCEFGGTELADAVLNWLAGKAGPAGVPLLRLLVDGRTAEILSVGITLHVLTGTPVRTAQDRQLIDLALARLEYLWTGSSVPITKPMLEALGQTARGVVEARMDDPARWQEGHAALQMADRLLSKLQASTLGRESDLLPTGLTAALQRLANALRTSPVAHLSEIEEAWATIEGHRLAIPQRGHAEDPRVGPFHAAVRLVRWLQSEESVPATLADAVRRHVRDDAWVDAAYNDAASGVSDQLLAEGLASVLRLTEDRRRAHDRVFADLLAQSTMTDEGRGPGRLDGSGDAVWHLERLLPSVVVPLARTTKTLLLVLDGMSAASAAELASTILQGNEGWAEAIPSTAGRRGSAVAVLPTLTTLSRTSLFSGKLASGGQSNERSGFTAVAQAGGLSQAVLFHKAPLDSARPGVALQDDIDTAIADPNTKLVACVLNTIDDALDKSDPAGITWTPETVRHLRPLLSAAKTAGRTVVMTSDHGHIVERRRGEMRSFHDISSARSRAAEGAVGEDEVLVQGRRVLTDGGRAVLAVDETLRYGTIKAGYHGGAAPAEVVVPVVVLVPGDALPDGWKEAPPQEPLWWSVGTSNGTVSITAPTPSSPLASASAEAHAKEGGQTSLFDELQEAPMDQAGHIGLGASVLGSRTFKAQKGIAGRVAVTDAHVAALLDAFAAAPATRLTKEAAAVVLQVPVARINGAVAQLQKLLNVEGYGVLRADGAHLVLDVKLLREQFEVNDRG